MYFSSFKGIYECTCAFKKIICYQNSLKLRHCEEKPKCLLWSTYETSYWTTCDISSQTSWHFQSIWLVCKYSSSTHNSSYILVSEWYLHPVKTILLKLHGSTECSRHLASGSRIIMLYCIWLFKHWNNYIIFL